MAQKLVVYARRAGVDDVAIVEDAYWAVVPPRVQHFGNVFHHDVLHPARTALILIENGGCRDGIMLAAGQLTETYCPSLRVPQHVIATFDERVARLAAAVPDPLTAREALPEALVLAEQDAALIAVAERLDHARHLHMRERHEWPGFFEQVLEVYLPVAQRISQDIARRFERWAVSFRRRL